MSSTRDPSILEVVGGEGGCKRIAQAFYARVATSPELQPLFPGKSLKCATEEFAAFLVQFFDGNADQTQYRWWLSLRESHARFQISDLQRAVWLRLMQETIHSLSFDASTKEALGQFFFVTSAYVIGRNEGEVAHPEMQERWARQLVLDRLIEYLTLGQDSEAIDLARQVDGRRSVLVGVLARMMDVGREPLIEFVVDCVRTDRALGEGRFNGRTLLHFAAGSSCLPVVRELLSLGVDPNVLDAGGHTALYRAASSRRGDDGAAIVRELVEAGATVDHCGGVQRSTALHEAARNGNLPVAKALLLAGASVAVKDKKGFTPLDRARNCRRREVVVLLEATGLVGA